MLMPKRVKYRKMHRGRRKGIATRGATVAFGDFGLQAMEACWMSNRQIEAARRAMTRHVKRGGQIWIRVFPDKSITKKPAETRMGSGKGNPEGWVAVVKPGRVLFEMGGVTQEIAKEAMKLAASKHLSETDYLSLYRLRLDDVTGGRQRSAASATSRRRAASTTTTGTGAWTERRRCAPARWCGWRWTRTATAARTASRSSTEPVASASASRLFR